MIEVDFELVNGKRFEATFDSVRELNSILSKKGSFKVNPPGTIDSGWRIYPQHIVAYRIEEE